MQRVDNILPKIKPTIVPKSRGQNQPRAVFSHECRVAGQRRRIGFGRPHVRKEQPAQLPYRIRRVFNFLAKSTSRRLEGLLQTISLDVIKPTMIEAPYSFFFDVAVFQRAAAMRTVQPDEPEPALSIPEEHQLFT